MADPPQRPVPLAFAAAALVAARPRPPPLPIPALRGGFQLPPFNNANANPNRNLLGVNIHFAFETHFPTLGVDPIAQVDGLAQATLRNEDALRRLPDVARKTLQRRKEQVDRVRAYAAENNAPTATAAAVTDHFIPLTQVVERIARLSPFPPRRIALNDALELAKAARTHLSSFPEIVDEDIFVEAVGWSRSKFARLEKGVSMINGDGGANERLSKLRSAVEEADTLLLRQQQQQQQQQTSPQTSPISSIVLPVVSNSPGGGGGGGVVGGSAPGVLPVATVGRLISAVDFASPVLTWHRKTDGGCCYIKDASEEWLLESVLLIRRACLIGFTVLTQQCERIRARDGTRWDASARVDQVKRTAEFLASADLAVSRAQNEHAIWWGRRCSFNENEFELLANDPKARSSGDALYIADGEGPLSDIPAESAEIIAGFRAVGAERALLVDSTGSPLPLGIAFSSAAMTLIHSVRARSSTVDSVAEALSAFESNNKSNNNSCVVTPSALTLDSEATSTSSPLTPQKVNNDKESMNSPSSPTTSTATASAVASAAAALDSLLGSIRTGSTQRSLNIIKSVLTSGDDAQVSVLKAHGTSGLSPLQLAISTGDVEVVKALLLEANIDPASSVNKTDSGGGTGSNALHAIAAKGGPSSLVMLDAALAALKSTDRNLSERRRVLDSINSAGVTCMHLAARNVVSTRREAISAVLALLNAGASPLVKSASGHQRPAKTALQNLVEVHCSTSSAGAASERETTDTSSLSSSGNMTVLSGNALSAGLERFLFNEQFADVAIVVSRDGSEDEDIDRGVANSLLSTNVDKVSIPAHRVILASLSEFFETLLCGEWRETGSRQVQLSGCSEIHARRILCFAYTGRLDIPPGDARTALDLLRIASRYRAMTLVNVLQSFCLSSSCLTVQTAWMTYDVAVECGFDASRLKDGAVGFILQNFESVVGRGGGKKEDEEGNDLKTEASSTTFTKALLQLLRNEILVE